MPCSIFLRCLIISLLLSSSEGFFANEARQQRRNVAASPLYLRSKSLTRHPRVPFSSLFSASTSFDTIHSGKERNKQNIITAMLAVSYMSVIISVMTLPPCLAYLDKDKTFAHKHLFPTILFIATLSTMLGKFLLGPPTDTYGGNKALKGIMASNILLLILCSLSNNSLSFGALWIVLQFFYAAAWGACSKLVRSSFPPSLWSNKLALVAAASRLGSLGSSFIFGGILAWKRNWRHTFICSALLQSAALLFYQLYDRKARLEYPSSGSVATLTTTSDAVNASSLSEESSSKLLQRVIRQPQFWSMLAGKIALMTVGQFISFIPLYLNTGAKLESSRAAIFAASFSTGSLISNLIGARFYSSLSLPRQTWLVGICNFTSTLISLVLALNAKAAVPFGTSNLLLLLSLWGATWSTAFYVPPGLVALELGGLQHSALITNIFDAFGFLGAAVFSFYATKLGRRGEWFSLLSGLSACSGIALISMAIAMNMSSLGELAPKKR